MTERKKIIMERIARVIKSTNSKKNYSADKPITQKEFADECEISPNTLSKAITKGEMSIDTAIFISKATGFSLDYLYGNSDDDNIQDYALNVIQNHMPCFCRKGGMGNATHTIQWLSVSEPLAKYFEDILKIDANKNDDMYGIYTEKSLQKAKDAFLKEIDKKQTEYTEYALLRKEQLTAGIYEILGRGTD